MKRTLERSCKKRVVQEAEWEACLRVVNQAIAGAFLLTNSYDLWQLDISRRLDLIAGV